MNQGRCELYQAVRGCRQCKSLAAPRLLRHNLHAPAVLNLLQCTTLAEGAHRLRVPPMYGPGLGWNLEHFGVKSAALKVRLLELLSTTQIG